jgi:3-dehydroquinate synthase
VVSADEREAGERAHLNFGHTVGHAIESAVGFDKIGHGEAVSLGMVAACELAVNRGLLPREDASRVRSILERVGLPVNRRGLKPAALWRIMRHDKKNRDGKVRMVLPTTVGSVLISDSIQWDDILSILPTLQ